MNNALWVRLISLEEDRRQNPWPVDLRPLADYLCDQGGLTPRELMDQVIANPVDEAESARQAERIAARLGVTVDVLDARTEDVIDRIYRQAGVERAWTT